MTEFLPLPAQLHRDRGASVSDAINQVEAGYPFNEFEALAADLGLTQQRLAEVLRISGSTLARRRSGRFNALESGRIYRFRRLLDEARLVISIHADAGRWLTAPNANLGGGPVHRASTEPGMEALLRYLEQIDAGVLL
jgi:putative toxin-antitoxin system antitoxin component (TIGR02293 family)